MLGGCFAAGGTGALHKIDGIMRSENSVDILKQNLKTSARKIHPTYCGKLVEGYLKRWTQVKQFKGNATKY